MNQLNFVIPTTIPSKATKVIFDLIDFFCVLTPLSTIFQLYHGDQF